MTAIPVAVAGSPVAVAGNPVAVAGSPVGASALVTGDRAGDPFGAGPSRVTLPREAVDKAAGVETTAEIRAAMMTAVARAGAGGLKVTAKASPVAGSLAAPIGEAIHAVLTTVGIPAATTAGTPAGTPAATTAAEAIQAAGRSVVFTATTTAPTAGAAASLAVIGIVASVERVVDVTIVGFRAMREAVIAQSANPLGPASRDAPTSRNWKKA